ncbi:ABC transporter ATP-binding protein [Pseudonocardia lacus]|uniref:ABC transporter ATP-binding protein n=1 Tax=Pseudonocardia lacus TaxID=2835865 RepID=UPI0027E24A20|nr:ABC transporter ATP-binding protein [Pseudonocardia lacus]
MSALLEVRDLVKTHRVAAGTVHAVSGVSLRLDAAETLALVGESGCGKSTVGRAILQLPPPDSGRVAFDGTELTTLSRRRMRALRPGLQMVLQDPRAALHPRRRVRGIVAEGLVNARRPKGETAATVDAVLTAVGLDPAQVADRRPEEFSGGQCQRIAIARALAVQPRLLVCDEPVASLDVSVQAQVINLLADLRAERGLAMLFISHDLAVVRTIADRVAVMYLGRVVETGPVAEVYARPRHPYTRALLDSSPVPDPDAPPLGPALSGEVPSPLDPPSGCRFRTRCPLAEARCAAEVPALAEVGAGHRSACHFAADL